MLHKEEEYISGGRKKKRKGEIFQTGERELTVLEIRDGRNYRCGCFQLSGVGLLVEAEEDSFVIEERRFCTF